MRTGKLSQEFLSDLLKSVPLSDPRVHLGPEVGEDAALIDIGDKYLVAKTDPITFTTKDIGWYAVQVNTNDIAVMGATAKWMLATILLPESVEEEAIRNIFQQMTKACTDLCINLVGGHTEVTGKLDRPLVIATMLGEVDKGSEILTSGAKSGDSILMTKEIAIEGSSILAHEAEEHLLASGIDGSLIGLGKNLLTSPGISVVPEAKAIASTGKVNAMHDPTEGGIIGGLRELAACSELSVHIYGDTIPKLDCTRYFCDALSLDPLGLLASGSLLACVPSNDETMIINLLANNGIIACKIGEMTDVSLGNQITYGDITTNLPYFDRDELARYFSESADIQ